MLSIHRSSRTVELLDSNKQSKFVSTLARELSSDNNKGVDALLTSKLQIHGLETDLKSAKAELQQAKADPKIKVSY